MLLTVYFEKKVSESLTKDLDKMSKKYNLSLNSIDNLVSGLEGVDPLKGKLKVFYSVITRRYISVINTYLNRGNSNIDEQEPSQIKILLVRIKALAYSIKKQVLQYIATSDSKDKEIIEKQKIIRKNVILKIYLLFKLIEKINSFFGQNEVQYKKFINFIYSKIFDLFERENEAKKIYKNDEKYFRNFPELISGLRPHKALENIITSNKKTEKEDKRISQVKTYYLNYKGNFNFLIIPIAESQFYINEPTPFDFLIEQEQDEFSIISIELDDIDNNELNILKKDIKSKKPVLSTMFNIVDKNNKKVNLKDINDIKNINVIKYGSFSINNIERHKNKEINLEENFKNSKIGEIQIE